MEPKISPTILRVAATAHRAMCDELEKLDLPYVDLDNTGSDLRHAWEVAVAVAYRAGFADGSSVRDVADRIRVEGRPRVTAAAVLAALAELDSQQRDHLSALLMDLPEVRHGVRTGRRLFEARDPRKEEP